MLRLVGFVAGEAQKYGSVLGSRRKRARPWRRNTRTLLSLGLFPIPARGPLAFPETAVSREVAKLLIRGFPGGAVVMNLPSMQGTQVQALVWEDPTCRGATKPVRHNY